MTTLLALMCDYCEHIVAWVEDLDKVKTQIICHECKVKN